MIDPGWLVYYEAFKASTSSTVHTVDIHIYVHIRHIPIPSHIRRHRTSLTRNGFKLHTGGRKKSNSKALIGYLLPDH